MGHGSLLAGRYRLEERVRTGPDGSLWRAVDETLDRPVSVRVVRPGHRYTADVVDAARRASLVEDPRLVRVLDVGESNGSAYIVAEHLVGRTLEEILAEGPLPAPVARRLVGEAAQALDRASARGLHHLRLSPAGVVVGPDGSIKVLGTAVEAALAGVEQDEDPFGADRADAVGLVRVLYATLTGRWPGPVEGPLGAAIPPSGRLEPPADLVPGVPNDLDTLCAVTLGPHDDGPHTPGELAAQLAPWPPLEPIGPRRPLPPRAATGPADHRPQDDAAQILHELPVRRPSVASGTLRAPSAASASASAQPGSSGPAAADAGPTLLPRHAAELAPLRPREPVGPPAPAPVTVPPPVLPGSVPPGSGSGGSGLGGFGPGFSGSGGFGPGGGPRSDADDAAHVWSMLAATRPEAPPLPVGRRPGGSRPHRFPSVGDEEPLGPFIPSAPVARPPRDQARFVIVVLAGVVVLGLVLAVVGLVRGVSSSAPLVGPAPTTAPVGSSPAASAASATSPGTAAATGGQPAGSPSGSSEVSATPASVAGIEALDPQGDGSEGGGTAPRAIDDDPSTTWRSDRYRSADFGGLKQGLGLFLRVTPGRVASVRVSMSGTGGTVELRTAAGPSLEGSTVLATASPQDGVAVLTPPQPVDGGPLMLWFTAVPQQSNGEYRIIVSEIAVT